MIDEEFKKDVFELVKKQITKGYYEDENTVVHMECILTVLANEYAEVFVNVAVNDTSGLDTYNFIKDNDLFQKAINANYSLYKESEISLMPIDYLFLQSVKTYLLYHIMETVLGCMMSLHYNQSKFYERLQIIVAEQYILSLELNNLISDSKLKDISVQYNKDIEDVMLNFPLDDKDITECITRNRNYTKEELVLDARYAYIDNYIMKKTPNAIVVVEEFSKLSRYIQYKLNTILNFNASMYLTEKYNINIVDLKEFIEKKNNE